MSKENVADTRIKEFENKLKDLLEKYGLELTCTIDFPLYKQLPDEVLLALKVLERHQGNFKLNYLDKRKKDAN